MEAAAALDGAKGRLQAAADPKPASRKQDPSYHVFKQTGAEGEFSQLTVAGAVRAASRKEAIAKVSNAFNKDGAEAETFLVIAEKELKLLTRRVQTKVEEIFE